MQQAIPPTDCIRKEKFYLNKFKKYNQNIVENVDKRCNTIDAFLDEIDNTISSTRAIFNEVDKKSSDQGFDACRKQQETKFKGVIRYFCLSFLSIQN